MKTDEKFKQFPWYGVFISYLLRFFHISTLSKKSEQLGKYIVCPIKDTNNSTLHCKSQYV